MLTPTPTPACCPLVRPCDVAGGDVTGVVLAIIEEGEVGLLVGIDEVVAVVVIVLLLSGGLFEMLK